MLEPSQVKSIYHLYKFLFKSLNKLPGEAQKNYYRNYIRSQHNSHKDEFDSERIDFIIKRSYEQAEWVLKKFQTKN
jgi:DNA repair photolyase